MINLRNLTAENFRGFNKRVDFDLDGRLLLFYGLNGRGKSSVFQGLELALFPGKAISDLREEAGEIAPLTNRFNTSDQRDTGHLELSFEWNGDSYVVHQLVVDRLAEMKPADERVHRKLHAHQHRVFFTQRFLRDLVLSTPRRRYPRVKQLLGCDAYDELVSALWTWGRQHFRRSSSSNYQLERLMEVYQGLQPLLKQLKKDLPEGALRGVEGPSLDLRAAQIFYQAIRRNLEEYQNRDLTQISLGTTSPRSFGSIATRLYEARKRLQYVRQVLDDTFNTEYRSERAMKLLPRGWRNSIDEMHGLIAEAYGSFAAQRDKVSKLLPSELTAVLTWSSSELDDSKLGDASTRHQLALFEQARDFFVERAGELTKLTTSYQSEIDRYVGKLSTYAQAAQKLRRVDDGLEFLQEDRANSVEERAAVISRRKKLVNFVELTYKGLMELSQRQLAVRAALLEDRWNQYYGEISSYSHFQELRIETEVLQSPPDHDRPWWVTPPDEPYLLRFMVSDPADKHGARHRMEVLLSEGQLNCAVVSLVLSLTDLVHPMRVLALDDPFVSWDDVNMENFLGALRRLTEQGWLIILTTCDPRVVVSTKKNMETVPTEKPAVIFTFRDWDKETGPCVEREPLHHRDSVSLQDLITAGELRAEKV